MQRGSNKRIELYLRRCNGAQIPEFSAALMMLVLIVFLPLLDIGIMPVRYFMACETVEAFVHEVSHADTFTHAVTDLEASNGPRERMLQMSGVEAKSLELHLLIASINDSSKFLDVTKPKTIPAEWLPNSKRGPFNYTLEVVATLAISPAVKLNFEPKIPLLSDSFPVVVRLSCPWENMARNPVTKNFYMNE